MSADLLREAAALMRERAEAATPNPWSHDGGWTVSAEPPDGWNGPFMVTQTERSRADAEHIASWHPAVALAVADWLEDALDAHLHVRPGNYPSYLKALAVATAYLGAES